MDSTSRMLGIYLAYQSIPTLQNNPRTLFCRSVLGERAWLGSHCLEQNVGIGLEYPIPNKQETMELGSRQAHRMTEIPS